MKDLLKEYWKIVWGSTKGKLSFITLLLSLAAVSYLEVLIPSYSKEIVNFLGADFNNTADQLIYQAFTSIIICYAIVWSLWRVFEASLIPHQIMGMNELDKIGFKILQKQKYQFFQNEFAGKIVKKIGKFVRAYETISDWFFFNLWSVLTLMIFTFISFHSEITVFAYIFLVWAFTFLTFTFFYARFQFKYNKSTSEADSKIGGIYADSFSNIFTVKSSGIENREFLYASEYIDDFTKKQTFEWILSFTMFAIQGILSIGIQLLFVYLMIEQWKNGVFEIGQYVLFQTLLLFMIHRIWEFGRAFKNLFGALADASEMAEIMQITDIEEDSSSAKHHDISGGEIEFRNMCFGYEEKKNVGVQYLEPKENKKAQSVVPLQKNNIDQKQLFQNFNLHIQPGEKIALVGHSGSGKTTLTNLLFRFFEPQNGGIYFDNIESKDFTYQSLRSQISLVPQNPEMFHRTLRENITLGKEVSDEKIWDALEKAQGKTFAKALENGLDTMIGERGVKLSGGEKQRVAISRAFLDNSKIVVLDEATSALDSITENELQKGIFKLISDKTAIVIAHRLSTIMKMDRIVVMEKGKIIQQGTHKQLLEEGGKYAEMWSHQRGGFLIEE